MLAILSDIHGNLEATQAVLADAQEQGATSIYCLGDLVGYGPDPIACIEIAMQWDIVLMGEFDLATVDQARFSEYLETSSVRIALNKVRTLLERHANAAALRQFLTMRPDRLLTAEALFVHGTPRDPIGDYLFPEDIYSARKMKAVAEPIDALCFCGHSHVPGIYLEQRLNEWSFLTPAECQYTHPVRQVRLICNVGSVGQPRDGDPRACYVLFDEGVIRFRRVEYDTERTVAKIRRDDDLDDLHGSRLLEGR